MFNNFSLPVADFIYLYLHNKFFLSIYNKVDIIKFYKLMTINISVYIK